MSNIIDKIRLSGVTYTLSATSAGGSPTVELTQAEYDALVSAGTVASDTYYIISDAPAVDISNYWTSAQTQSAITQSVSGKASQSDVDTLSGTVTAHTADTTIHVTSSDKTTWSGKQDALVSGTNIKTINNESILGSGNITIQGGGGGGIDSGTVQTMIDESISVKVDTSAITSSVTSASTDSEIPTAKAVYDAIPTGGTGGGKTISAGTNISVTTGETADTVSCKIPYSDVIYSNTDIILGKELPNASTSNRVLFGKQIKSVSSSNFAYSIGIGVQPSSNSSDYNELYGSKSIGIGAFKIGNGSQYSNFVTNCVAIGYGAKTRISNAVAIGNDTEASGTTKTNINNQLTIDTSNQVYIYNKDNTEMICLQDHLGGGGGGITSGEVQTMIDESISGKADSSSLATVATSGSYNDLTNKPTIPTVPTSNTAFTNDAGYITSNDITGKTDTSAFTAHTADTTVHTTSAEKTSWNGAVTALGGLSLVKLTQSAYDALSPDYDSNTLYVIVN